MTTRLFTAALLLVPAAALAHPGHGASGLGAGLAHPLLGLDHLLAMAGIGFWAAWRRGGREAGAIGAAFLVAMLVGFGIGLGQAPAAMVEFGIVGSVLVTGALVLGARRLPMPAAAALAALFALCHGHAHGVEMAAGLSALQFGVGFAFASAALLGAGAAAARLCQLGGWLRTAERGVGGALLAASAYLLIVV